MHYVDVMYRGVDDINSKKIQADFLITLFNRGLDKSVVSVQILKSRKLSVAVDSEDSMKAFEIVDVMKNSVELYGGEVYADI